MEEGNTSYPLHLKNDLPALLNNSNCWSAANENIFQQLDIIYSFNIRLFQYTTHQQYLNNLISYAVLISDCFNIKHVNNIKSLI